MLCRAVRFKADLSIIYAVPFPLLSLLCHGTRRYFIEYISASVKNVKYAPKQKMGLPINRQPLCSFDAGYIVHGQRVRDGFGGLFPLGGRPVQELTL